MTSPVFPSRGAVGSRRLHASAADSDGDPTHPKGKTTRVMVVDDSLTVRTIFKRMVESDSAMSIAGTASSAERAIAQLKTTPTDVILLDLEMPGMGGLEALPEILETARNAEVLVVSSLTEDGAEHTMSALSMGAADTMLKPRPGGFDEDYRRQLLGKIRALGAGTTAGEVEPKGKIGARPASMWRSSNVPIRRPEVVAIGASTGGIHALNLMLRRLTPAFDIPILITQHLPASFIPVFARQIEMACARPAIIAVDGTEIRRGEVAIASGLGHMVLRQRGEQLIARVSTEPQRSGCLPSVDPMFSSLAEVYRERVLAVVLSGMGRDGLEGARAIAKAGGMIYAQDAETSAVWGMPGAVAKEGLANLVAAPETLGLALMSAARCQHTAEQN